VVDGLAPRVTEEDTPLVLANATGDAITLSVPDGTSQPIAIALVASHGTVSLAGAGSVQFSAGGPVGSTSMAFVGMPNDINAALDGLTFVPEADYAGDAGICVVITYAPQRGDITSLCVDRVETASPATNEAPSAVVSVPITVTPVNDPPTLSVVADQVAMQSTTVGPIPLVVADVDGPPSGPTVLVTSSNEALVPNSSIVLRGNGANRLLTIVPRANAVGATVITIAARDETSTTTRSIALSVLCDSTAASAVPVGGGMGSRSVNAPTCD
jgi:hypothetical protein